MKKILHIASSPRKGESASRALAEAFLDSLAQHHAEIDVETLDLFTADLPAFEAPQAKAKYAVLGGREPTSDAERAWKQIIELADHFKSADGYVLSVPMWNFHIPYRLKQYFDLIVQPSLTFTFSPEDGYDGLVTGRPALLALARGGDYSPGTGMESYDAQRPYLIQILGYIGITDVRCVEAQPMLAAGPDAAKQALERAITQARHLAEPYAEALGRGS